MASRLIKVLWSRFNTAKAIQEIVRSMLHVAKKLNLNVVVEGIESTQQEQFILEQGCDVGQGFLYGKPMPSEVFTLKLESHALA